jgi:hypothetical protein
MSRPEADHAHADPQVLIDSLLFSVSHDLRSPLLTILLGVDLLQQTQQARASAAEGDETATLALESLRHGATDLERMLSALTALSRARRRTLEIAPTPLRMLLAGYDVSYESADLAALRIETDLVAAREALDAFVTAEDCPIEAGSDGARVVLRIPGLPEDLDRTPLTAFAASIQQYAGGTVEALAVGQVLIERMDGTVRRADGHLEIRLLLAAQAAGGFDRRWRSPMW